MKKIAMILVALVFVGGIWAIGHTTALRAEQAAGQSVMCPTCKIEIPTGQKPVIEMLAGKSHTCSSCGKQFDEVAGKTAHTCTKCGSQVDVCPVCGKTELISKA